MNRRYSDYIASLTIEQANIVMEGLDAYMKGISDEVKTIKTSWQLYEKVQFLELEETEKAVIVYMDTAGHVISMKEVSKGGINECLVDVRVVLKEALRVGATRIAMAHNHPRGVPKPSLQDNSLTEKLKNAAKCIDISLVDHLIVGNGNYFSYADEGM